MGASATKSFARTRIFRYGLRNYILSRGGKNKAKKAPGGPNHLSRTPSSFLLLVNLGKYCHEFCNTKVIADA